MKNIKLLNPVSSVWNEVISENDYNLSAEAVDPDAIIVRSADMHSYDLEKSVWAVARAGVGVNNIPLDEYAEKGVVVIERRRRMRGDAVIGQADDAAAHGIPRMKNSSLRRS